MQRLGVFIILGIVTLMVASCVPISRLGHTCGVCRMSRVDAACFGLTHSTYHDNECSRWYLANVEPKHNHLWERGTYNNTTNLLGVGGRVGCNPGRYPIRLLAPSTQLHVYQHFKDPIEAKKLWLKMAIRCRGIYCRTELISRPELPHSPSGPQRLADSTPSNARMNATVARFTL